MRLPPSPDPSPPGGGEHVAAEARRSSSPGGGGHVAAEARRSSSPGGGEQVAEAPRSSSPSPLAGEGRGGGAYPVNRLRIFGPLSGLGLAFALLAFGLDQAMKWWMLGPFDIAARQPVKVTPF